MKSNIRTRRGDPDAGGIKGTGASSEFGPS